MKQNNPRPVGGKKYVDAEVATAAFEGAAVVSLSALRADLDRVVDQVLVESRSTSTNDA